MLFLLPEPFICPLLYWILCWCFVYFEKPGLYFVHYESLPGPVSTAFHSTRVGVMFPCRWMQRWLQVNETSSRDQEKSGVGSSHSTIGHHINDEIDGIHPKVPTFNKNKNYFTWQASGKWRKVKFLARSSSIGLLFWYCTPVLSKWLELPVSYL